MTPNSGCFANQSPSLGTGYIQSSGLWLALPFTSSPFVHRNKPPAHNNPLAKARQDHVGFSTIHAGDSITDSAPLINAPSLMSVVSVKAPIRHSHVLTHPRSKLPEEIITQNLPHKNHRNDLGVPTPIKIDHLIPYLNNCPLAAYLISGFCQGFRVGFTGHRSASTSPNLKSCDENTSLVEEKLNTEIHTGRISGPFSNPPFVNLKISPIGLVPKKSPGQYRLIHHLSYPRGSSVNDYIDPTLSTVQYQTFDDAITLLLQLGPGTLFCKTDIESAFRLIPIHPADYCLLGFKFKEQYFYDRCLPMGISSACAIFERFSSTLQHIASTHLNIPHMVHILDDFLFLGPPQSELCQQHLDKFLSFCHLIGVPIKQEKNENATTIITFLGLEFDSNEMEARLPNDKLIQLRELLQTFTRKRKCTLKQMQSLLGLLNFCCQVVVPGRSFLRRITDLTKKVSRPHHRITLNKESRRDIQAWLLFADHFNGKSLLLSNRWVNTDTLHLHTDASGAIGFGAVFGLHWFNGLAS